MSLGTGISRLVLLDRWLTGEVTVVHQRRNTFAYDGKRRIWLVVDRRTREEVRACGNRLYVWGSSAGPESLIHADVHAPPQRVQFDHLRNGESFDLFVDRDLYLEGLVVRHRRVVRPRFYLRPFRCDP